jgi:nucleoside diphosphate kinase
MNIPLFPNQNANQSMQGITLRDYFAAQAMTAVIINSDRQSTNVEEVDLWIGSYSYIVANAMMKARER